MSSVHKLLGLVDKVLNYVEVPILLFTSILLLGALFYGALVRYLHLGSFPEETELSWLFYTWMVFIGSSSVLRRGEHPHVSFMRNKLGWKYEVIIHAVSMIYLGTLMYVLVSYSWLYAKQKTAVMALSLAYFYNAAIIGFSLMITRYFIKILTHICAKARGEEK